MRESKKIFSRTFLVIVNLLAFLASGAIIFLGSLILRSAKSASEKSASNLNDNTIDVSGVQSAVFNLLRAIAITLIVYGAFILLTAVCGFFGACTRNNGLLGCYISTLVFDVILTIAVAIYSIVVLVNRMKEWDNYSVTDWTGFNDAQRDYYQLSFGCCGFDESNSNAYTGESFFLEANNCTTAAITAKTYPGCKQAGHDYYYRFALYDGIGSAVILVILLCCISAAHHARKTYYNDSARQPMVTVIAQRY
ncbi:hypothetical protein HDU67_001461 [Dinochytrium kinnereticum]|nr:hypothetical protein HDU67_001461 [Dinochytrium kinnereticum]